MPLTFIPITTDRASMEPYLRHPFCKEVYQVFSQFYPRVGYLPPWIGYFFLSDQEVVGTGAFKGPPVDGKVEIAYGTVPGYEGKGIATRICEILVRLAHREDPGMLVTARTLMEEGPSTAILRKNGFRYAGVVKDPEDGDVWEWTCVID